jgi:hypothetical protein
MNPQDIPISIFGVCFIAAMLLIGKILQKRQRHES